MSDVTRILEAIDHGDPHAASALLSLVYDELRKLAAAKMAQEAPGHTLQATALVHEAYLRLVESGEGSERRAEQWNSRGHFFAAAAEAMRRILIDNARRKQTQKHGRGRVRQPLDEITAPDSDQELLALDEALAALAIIDAPKARLVELRYFGGLTGAQAAEILGISPTTADRWWTYARAWLQAKIRGS
jgi:RNA polymerase sigma factor (TIGR02999 family)